jgi:hypothetical protein
MSRALLRIFLATLLSASLACATTSPPTAEPGAEGSQPEQTAAPGEAVEPELPAGDDADKKTQAQKRGKNPIAKRAEAGLESTIMGTVIGGQIGGTYGAAIGAAIFGLYGLITGDVPFDSGRSGSPSAGRRGGADADEALESEIEEELAKQEELEAEIEAELKRQEELLAAINKQEEINEAVRQERADRLDQDFDTDPLSAPTPPQERDIPDTLYERETRQVGKEKRVVKTLDADRDGRPEIQIVFDEKTGEMLSRAEDTDYDGLLDTQNTYEDQQIIERSEDTDHDGQPDRWTYYEDGRGTRVEVDRNYDGQRDGTYIYEGGTLAREEHDTNSDGVIDRRVEYQHRRRLVELEDRNADGEMDFWVYYDANENPIRVEKDTDGDGNADVWEHYEGDDPGEMVIVRKDEDLDGDGSVDVKSHYKKGKLNRKEVLNPSALKK